MISEENLNLVSRKRAYVSACPLPFSPPHSSQISQPRHGPRMRIREGLRPAEEHTVGLLSGTPSLVRITQEASSVVQIDPCLWPETCTLFP